MLKNYLDTYSGRRVGFVGAGVSNLPIIRLFAGAGADVIVRDRKLREQTCTELEKAGVRISEGDGYLDGIDECLLFLSPAVRPDIPQLLRAAENGVKITSEMQEFFELCPCTITAVTGSDGKTTTTTLIAKLLEESGKKVILGGNIGVNLFSSLDGISPDDEVVAELSSFQLMKMTRSPDVAVITNISPNHLDWHRDFDEYIDAKRNIFRHIKPDGVLVINEDNDITRSFADSAGCGVRFFSRRDKDAFCFIDGEGIHCGGKLLLADGDIKLVGAHNRENFACAIAAVYDKLCGDALRRVATGFGGVEHRIEFVAQKNGVSFYNSSIDSSPTRTAAALRSFDGRVIVIAGGYDKKLPLEPLVPLFAEKTAGCVLMGDTGPKIASLLKAGGYPFPMLTAQSMDEAVAKAFSLAGGCGTVILSPAAASFDMFRNFEERGNCFKQAVLRL